MHPRIITILSILSATALFAAAGDPPAPGKTARETGVVVGYVSNAATTLYLEGARIEAPDGRTVFTDRDGHFEINLPSGPSSLVVSYTGLAPQTIPVEAGAVAKPVHNVKLTSDLYTMDKFTVSGVREGSALAITRQQQAPNVKNIVASDQFGNIADGNVGDLLQQLPGVSGEYNGQDIRSVQIRGIDAALNSVSMDGSQLAASDSSGLGRVFEFEQASLGMIEMIELTKAPTPDMAANSIGGHVNLVTKSAFDRAVARTFTYAIGGVYRTKYLLRSKPWWREPIKNVGPSMNFTYADRLGPKENVGVLFTATYHSQPGGDVAALFNYQNTTTDPAPITSVTAPRPAGSGRTRLALGGKVDYKLSERTILTFNTSYNWFYETPDTRSLAFATTAAAANFRPGYTADYQEIVPNNNSNATMTLGSQDNTGRTVVLAPSVRFRNGTWDIDYGTSYSNAIKRRGFPDDNPRTKAGNLPGSVVLAVRGNLGWIIDRTGDRAWPTITQTAGRDLYDLNNYTSGVQVTLADNGLEDTVFSGRVNARRRFDFPIPVSLKAGLNLQQQDRRAWNQNRRLAHVGPDGRANTGDEGLGAFLDTGGKYSDANKGNRMPPWPDPFAVTRYLVDSPQNWSDDLAFRTNQRLGQDRRITEKIYAGYVMASIQLGRLAMLPGVRVERTETDAEGPLSTGTPPVFTGRKRNEGHYQNAFPGIHLKYTPTRNLVTRASYSTSIGRPSFDSIIPSDIIDDVNQVVSISNPGLKPQFSDNFDVSIEYYFEPVGLVSATVFRKEITGFQFADSSQVVGAGPNNGFGGDYEGYRIRTTANGGRARYQGFELSYQQRLTFLPGFWKGFGVTLNYTKLETKGDYGGASSTSQLAGFVPQTGNAGINYVYHKLDLRLNAVWRSEILVTSSPNPVLLVYEQPRLQISLKTKYNFSRQLGVYFQIDNLNNAPITDRYRGFESRPLQTRVATPKIIAGVEGRF
ncbi:MAG: TonB-dependent receptor [Opitutaceae bacterium]|nr:TonB-dependent receptor [Opitutaceae bacterium]